jgi:NAD+ diphosphatase
LRAARRLPRRLAPPARRHAAADLAIYGGARSLVDWHARHRFCARCGSATRWPRAAGSAPANEACGADHFPRVDPVTIMLVEHDGCLLARAPAAFSCRALFGAGRVRRAGETMEEAVAREVFEEAGVRVRDVRYVASQPWPYPSSLMIACHALADDRAIAIDANELEDAQWFTRAQVAAALAGASDALFEVPPPSAVARHLLEWWMEQGWAALPFPPLPFRRPGLEPGSAPRLLHSSSIPAQAGIQFRGPRMQAERESWIPPVRE